MSSICQHVAIEQLGQAVSFPYILIETTKGTSVNVSTVYGGIHFNKYLLILLGIAKTIIMQILEYIMATKRCQLLKKCLR